MFLQLTNHPTPAPADIPLKLQSKIFFYIISYHIISCMHSKIKINHSFSIIIWICINNSNNNNNKFKHKYIDQNNDNNPPLINQTQTHQKSNNNNNNNSKFSQSALPTITSPPKLHVENELPENDGCNDNTSLALLYDHLPTILDPNSEQEIQKLKIFQSQPPLKPIQQQSRKKTQTQQQQQQQQPVTSTCMSLCNTHYFDIILTLLFRCNWIYYTTIITRTLYITWSSNNNSTTYT